VNHDHSELEQWASTHLTYLDDPNILPIAVAVATA
jgi:hypothetical protein